MASRAGDWTQGTLTALSIELDDKNPRIEVARGAAQNVIREKLLLHEDVADLARKIVKHDGLLQGERIISVVENGKHVVLEGNRRVAACQMLIEPSLIPTGYKVKFPKAEPGLKTKLKKILADVAPNRDAAEPILTRRHTEQGVKPWSPVAKMRRAARWLEDGLSFEDVAAKLGTNTSQVRKLVRPYNLLKFALGLKCWTPAERASLEDEKLRTNPYTRFFTLKDTKHILQLEFDDEEKVKSKLAKAVYQGQMERIARDFLLPDQVTGKPKEDTRTVPVEYFHDFLQTPAGKATAKKTISKKTPSKKTAGGAAKPVSPRASVFFEKVTCSLHDDILIKLAGEIRQIDHIRMPITASFLLRAIFEASLINVIKRKSGAWAQVVAAKKGKDPALSDLIQYAGNEKNAVFAELRICSALRAQTTRDAKDYLDLVIHSKWMIADSPTVLSAANNLRKIIEYILSGV